MFGRKKPMAKPSVSQGQNTPKSDVGPLMWDVPVFFGLMFVLSIIELCFTIFSYQHLERHHQWWSKTEKARLGFLIFSSVRTIILSGGYIYAHFRRKSLSMWRMFFLVMSAILWVISGVLIKTMYGYFQCGGIGKAKGGINECHTTKIIEIVAWILAGISVIATFPQIWTAIKKKRGRKAATVSEKDGARV